VQIDQELARIVPCFAIVALEGNPPEAVDTDQLLKPTYLNFTPAVI
jgi:hypothetical protein